MNTRKRMKLGTHLTIAASLAALAIAPALVVSISKSMLPTSLTAAPTNTTKANTSAAKAPTTAAATKPPKAPASSTAKKPATPRATKTPEPTGSWMVYAINENTDVGTYSVYCVRAGSNTTHVDLAKIREIPITYQQYRKFMTEPETSRIRCPN